MQAKNFETCNRLSLIFLSATVFIGMCAFLPKGFLAGGIVKGYVVVVGVFLSLITWLLGRLLEGTFRVPRSTILIAASVLLSVILVSAFFSPAPYLSFWGEGFDQAAFVPFSALIIALFLVSVLVTSRRKLLVFLGSLFCLFIGIALFQLAHLFFPVETAFGIFFDRTATLVGSSSDFVYLAGAMLVGGMFAIEFLQLSLRLRVAAYIASLIALFFVLLANIFVVWAIVGCAILFAFMYKMLLLRKAPTGPFPLVSFVMLLITLFFLFTHAVFGGALAKIFSVSFQSIAPSASATFHVARASLSEHFIFGAGPNRFFHEWLTSRPFSINETAVWDTPFFSGSSFLFTVAFLSGIGGILAVLFFLFSFVRAGFLQTVRVVRGEDSKHLIFGTFLVSVYFTAVLAFASPGRSILICAFVCVGLFIASLSIEKRIPYTTFSFLRDQRVGFFTLLLVVILIGCSVAVISTATKRLVSTVHFQYGIRAAQSGDIVLADKEIAQAIQLTDMPVYERVRALLAEQHLQKMISSTSSDQVSGVIKSDIQSAISTGTSSLEKASQLDRTDPGNDLATGNFMRFLSTLNVQNAVTSARDAYLRAGALAPEYPESYLGLAELYAGMGDTSNARVYVEQALSKKTNYAEAYFLLAKLDLVSGDYETAHTILSALHERFPNDANVTAALSDAVRALNPLPAAPSVPIKSGKKK